VSADPSLVNKAVDPVVMFSRAFSDGKAGGVQRYEDVRGLHREIGEVRRHSHTRLQHRHVERRIEIRSLD
jgi:hypothetical protein